MGIDLGQQNFTYHALRLFRSVANPGGRFVIPVSPHGIHSSRGLMLSLRGPLNVAEEGSDTELAGDEVRGKR